MDMAPPEYEGIDIGAVEQPDLRPGWVFVALEESSFGIPSDSISGQAGDSGNVSGDITQLRRMREAYERHEIK
jgi:hypothetical protein